MKGNLQKMRRALTIVYDWILKAGNVYGYPDTEQKRRQLYDMMTKALASPPRNCDVGTAEEQEDRFFNFCKAHECTMNCPIKKKWNFKCGHKPSCGVIWSQMPYESEQKGETDGSK